MAPLNGARDEERPLIEDEDANPIQDKPPMRTSTRVLIGAVAVAAWVGVLFGRSTASVSLTGELSTDASNLELKFHDRYTLRDGEYYADYEFVQKAKASLLAASTKTTAVASGMSCSDASPCDWTVEDVDGTISKSQTTTTNEITFKLSAAGAGKISVSNTQQTLNKALLSRYMRREVRNLFEDDRKNFFAALAVVYTTSTVDGMSTYGDGYKGAEYFIEYHTWMAGTKECDHLHDGMGFLTGHNAVTLEFENNLRLVDSSVSIPYWDYTIDMANVYSSSKDMHAFYDSELWTDDWFGVMGTDPEEHYAVTTGWASNITVDPKAWKMDPSSVRVTNAYGLLRSPWNSARDARLLRSNLTFGYSSSYKSAPRCSEFYKAMNLSDVVTFTTYAQANAHGAVHTMVGGVSNADWKSLFAEWGMGENYADSLGLQGFGAIKDFWRTGMLSCPTGCSSDTALEDCACSCPDFSSWDEVSARNILEDQEKSFDKNTWTNIDGEYIGLKFLALVCGEVKGYEAPFIGDAMNSGATADPSFWPVHPNVDRLFQWRNLAGMSGQDVWPYGQETSSSFYWGSGNEENKESCWGHQPENTMVWSNLGFVDDPFESDHYYTVKELWLLNDPSTGHLPYVYPNFKWEACAAEGYPEDLKWDGTVSTDDASGVWG